MSCTRLLEEAQPLSQFSSDGKRKEKSSWWPVPTWVSLNIDEEIFQQMTTLMNVDLKTIRKEGEEIKGKVLTVKPIYSEEELQTRIKEAFTQTGGQLTGFERILLNQGRVIYTGIIEKDGQSSRLFAEVVSQLPTCDVCHDVHFIYTFDTKGKILQFVPLQLTKYGNLNWD